MKVQGLRCPLRNRKLITLLISLEESMFSHRWSNVWSQNSRYPYYCYTTSMTDISLCFCLILIILFVFMNKNSYIGASSNSKLRSVDLEDFRSTLNWKLCGWNRNFFQAPFMDFWKSWVKPYNNRLGQDSAQHLPEITQKIPLEPNYWTIIAAISV
jgi:hypothetical protein